MLLNFRKRKIHIAQDHTQTLLTRGFCHIRAENLLKGLVPPLENLLLPPPHICLSPPFSSHKGFSPGSSFHRSHKQWRVEGIMPKSLSRAYSSCFMRAIVARMRLPFFKIFSNFAHFCRNFPIFCPFLAIFSEKSHACPYFLE